MSKICSKLTVRQINVNDVILANFVHLKNNAHTSLVSADEFEHAFMAECFVSQYQLHFHKRELHFHKKIVLQ